MILSSCFSLGTIIFTKTVWHLWSPECLPMSLVQSIKVPDTEVSNTAATHPSHKSEQHQEGLHKVQACRKTEEKCQPVPECYHSTNLGHSSAAGDPFPPPPPPPLPSTPPYLHLKLGIVKKHHQLLENHTLDEKIAQSPTLLELRSTSPAFQEYVKQSTELRQKESDKAQIESQSMRIIVSDDNKAKKQQMYSSSSSAFDVMVTLTRSSLPWVPHTWMSGTNPLQTPRAWFWGTHK